MNLVPWIWPVALAPIIGSFLGVVMTRVESPRSVLVGRSRCDSCGHGLATRDLIPLLSWLGSQGRCRYCRAPVSAFYPLIELAALGLALWSTFTFSGPLVWESTLFGWVLLALAVIDAKHFLLPDFLTLPLIPAGLVVAWKLDPSALPAHAIGAALGLFFIIGLRFAYSVVRGREGMGLGDAKLLCAAGAWVTWVGLPTVVLLAALSGLAFALLKGARGGTLSLADRLPFGTFLCLGTWFVWLYGPLAVG